MPSKKSRLHLYADENIAIPTVTHLRANGLSVQHAFDFNYVNKKDELHLKKSKLLNCVLLSIDKDFKKYKNATIDGHPGIILITSGSSTYQHINKILDKALKHMPLNYVKHSILRISMDKVVKERNRKVVNEKNI